MTLELSCSFPPFFVPSPQAHYQDLFYSTPGVRIYLELVRSAIWPDPCPQTATAYEGRGQLEEKGTILLRYYPTGPPL